MPGETTVLRAFVLGESRATWLLTQEKIHTIIGNIVGILFLSLDPFLQVIYNKPCSSLQFNICHWKSNILAASESTSPGLVCPGLHIRLYLHFRYHHSVFVKNKNTYCQAMSPNP